MKFVYVAVGNDYDMITYSQTAKVTSDVAYWPDPYHSLRGLRKALFTAHNSSRINSVIRLPFRGVWSGVFLPERIKKELDGEDRICFIFNEFVFQYLGNGIPGVLKKRFPGSVSVCLFDDRVEKISPVFGFDVAKKAAELFDFVLTYDGRDARDYGMIYSRPSLIDYSFVPVDPSVPASDVFYVGRAKDRLDTLIEVYDKCSEAGLAPLFYIIEVPEERIVPRPGIVYNRRLSYGQLLRFVKRSRAVVNITQKGAEGITLRDYEAFSMNKYLITNNPIITGSPFYTPEKVILLDSLPGGLATMRPENDSIPWNGTEEYSAVRYYEWLAGLVFRTSDEG